MMTHKMARKDPAMTEPPARIQGVHLGGHLRSTAASIQCQMSRHQEHASRNPKMRLLPLSRTRTATETYGLTPPLPPPLALIWQLLSLLLWFGVWFSCCCCCCCWYSLERLPRRELDLRPVPAAVKLPISPASVCYTADDSCVCQSVRFLMFRIEWIYTGDKTLECATGSWP